MSVVELTHYSPALSYWLLTCVLRSAFWNTSGRPEAATVNALSRNNPLDQSGPGACSAIAQDLDRQAVYRRGGLPPSGCWVFSALQPGLDRTRAHRSSERLVIALILAFVSFGKIGDCFVKDVIGAEIPANHRGIAGTRMGLG